jgi:PAS domain S-box-containing protein
MTEKNSSDHMQNRINNIFSGQDLPAHASLKEVEAMMTRIHELENAISKQEAEIALEKQATPPSAPQPVTQPQTPSAPVIKQVRFSIQSKITFWAGLSLVISTLILIAYSAINLRNNAVQNAQNEAIAIAQAQAINVENQLNPALTVADSLANSFAASKDPATRTTLTREQANAILKKVLIENPQFLGTWTVWEPNAFDGQDKEFANTPLHDQTGRFIPYWVRSGEDNTSIEGVAIIEYETPGIGDFYIIPRETQTDTIISPYFYPINNVDVLMTSLAVPIVENNKFYGVAGVDFKLDFVQNIVNEINLYDATANAVLFTDAGTLVAVRNQPELSLRPATSIFTDFAEIQPNLTENKTFITPSPDGTSLRVFTPITFGKSNTYWYIALIIPLEKITAPATASAIQQALLGLALLSIALILLWFVTGRVVRPVRELTNVANTISAGNLNVIANVKSSDEIGVLANVFNTMVSQLRDTFGTMEQRVADRTRDLELASEVGRTVTAKIDNLYQLLSEAVEQIRSRFGLYYVQVYLTDRAKRNITLRAGTGDVGKQLLQRGHQLLITSDSLNGRAALEKQTVIVTNTTQSASFLPNPLLPLTRSEMAVPLIVGDQVVGVLDMQSESPNALNENNLSAFEALAGQLAVAIQNAALFEQANQARAEIAEQAKRLSFTSWDNFLNAVDRSEKIGFVYHQNEVLPYISTTQEAKDTNFIHTPIQVAGAEIGKIQIVDNPERQWSTSESELLKNTATQLSNHIENLRLLAQSEKYRADAEEISKRLTRESWDEYFTRQKETVQGYVYNKNRVEPLIQNSNGNPKTLQTHPIYVRNEHIGELEVETLSHTDAEANEIISAITQQLSNHIENLRLFEQAEINRLEVQKSQEQYELAVEGSNDGLWDWNITTNQVFFSPRWKAIVGYNEDELNEGFADFEKLLHPEDHDRVLGVVNDYLSGKLNDYNVEFRFRHKDGQYVWILARGKAMRNPDGSPYRMAGSHTDITGRKEAEEAVRNAQEQYSLAVQGSNDGIWDWDIAKESIYYSPRWKSMLGYEEHELTRGFLEWEERIHPEDRNRAVNALDDYLAQKTPEYDVELRLKHKAGHWVWIRDRGKAIRRPDGTAYRMAGAHTDITERKQAEALIAQRANQLETVADVSTAASTVLNPDALLQQVVNLTKSRFNLYHAHIYLLDENWNTLLLASGAGEIGSQMVAEGRAIDMNAEQSLVARSARERQPVIVNDVRNEAGFLPNVLLPNTRSEMALPMIVGETVIGVFDVQADTPNAFSKEDASIYTTLASQVAVALQNARLYQEQAATVTQLRELDRLKSSFLANMSHELRTPLNSILGFTEVMLEGLDGPLTPHMDNDLKLINKNGQHLLHLINDVLDMAKIESGKMNLIIEKFTLQEVLDDIISITSPLANEKKLALIIDPKSDAEVSVTADRTRLSQVMINLVNNALKFTEQGKVTIRAMREENNVLITVKDTGIGIPPEHLEAVFSEFTQVDSSTTRKAGGTGLGLPISRKLIEMHGGKLWAESNGVEGEGSTFFVFMPIENRTAISEPVTRKL